MSRIDDLLATHCPDGVEFRLLGDIARLVRGNGMPKVMLTGEGVGAIHYGQIYSRYGAWATSTHSFVTSEDAEKLAKADPGDIIITNTSENIEDVGKAVAWLGESTIVTGGHATVIKHDLEPKYLSYWLQSPSFVAQKRALATGTKVIDVSARQLMKVRIPVPPLEAQREIVRILDQFSEVEAALEAELEARRRQYEYYSNLLVDSDSDEGAKRVRLSDVAEFRRGVAFTVKEARGGQYPVVANSPRPIAWHDQANRQGAFLVVARSGAYAGSVTFWEGPLFLTDAFSVHPKAGVMSTRYALHLLRTLQEEIWSMKAGGGVPHVRVREIEGYEIVLPSLARQERVATVLDEFDALVNDLSVGLPAELAARRKQYEHYRDRLLTFKEAPA